MEIKKNDTIIGLREFMVNEVSSELLMKAAKKAKTIGDKRANKFFDAALKKAKEEFDGMSTDAKEEAKANSKKVFDKIKKLGKPNFGFGTQLENTLAFEVNGKQGFLIIDADQNGIIASKKMIGDYLDKETEGLSDSAFKSLAEKFKKMKDEEQLMFFKIGLSPDKEIKGPEIYRNCNFAMGIILVTDKLGSDNVMYTYYTQYRKDENYDGKQDPEEIPDSDLDDMVYKIAKALR